jgi:hypothetical protein
VGEVGALAALESPCNPHGGVRNFSSVLIVDVGIVGIVC